MSIHPFDRGINDPPDLKLSPFLKVSKQERWEHRVVAELLKHYELTDRAAELAQLFQQNTGVRRLTFEAFHFYYPGFPVWLVCRKVHWAFKVTYAQLVRRFPATRLFRAFQRAESDAPPAYWAGKFGLVFEWLHVWPTAIIHNYYHALDTAEAAVVYAWPKTDPPQVFAIQPFTAFLRGLTWSPPRDPML